MIELLLGIVCGIALSLFFSFGPAFFSQLRTSIQYGYRKSYPFAFGVSASDVLCVFLLLTVLQNVNLFELLHNVWVASIAGAVLLMMGVHYFRKEVTDLQGKESRIKFKSKDGEPRRLTILMQGFVINFVNPFIWIYWISVIALASGELNLSTSERYIFFIGMLGTTLALDILKCKLASMLQRIITAKLLNITNKVCAIFMFGFAAYLVVSMILYQVSPKAREREQNQPNNKTEMIKKLHNLPKLDSLSDLSPWKRKNDDTIHIDALEKLEEGRLPQHEVED